MNKLAVLLTQRDQSNFQGVLSLNASRSSVIIAKILIVVSICIHKRRPKNHRFKKRFAV